MNKEVVIVGGGPAGMLMGLLLAKENVNVTVLEKNKSLSRDFRGETIAPGSVYLLKKLGVFPALEEHGFIKVRKIKMYDREDKLFSVNFDELDHPQKYGIDMPQPVVLEALKEKALDYPNFQYIEGATFTDLIKEDRKVVGVRYKESGHELEVRTKLVIGAEGRYSRLQTLGNFQVKKKEFSRDLIWFKVPKPADWEEGNLIKVHKHDHVIILPTYPDFLRVGTYISLGGNRETKKKGISTFIDKVCAIEPKLRIPMEEHITSWDDTTLLKIFTAHVDDWANDGLILIGDSAHTLSPILGQGVNIAMQDAFELLPYVTNGLKTHSEALPANLFHRFIEERKKQVSFVSNFQARQEQNLSASSPLQCTIRKVKMKLLDKAPFKNKVMKKLQYGVVANETMEV
ncbi:FAD-dependent oxidoreductase [Halalkalibacter alkalisediminis]|uniref:FAD-dependent oxidoreductase n=1 Tax=Halalkalibacter alkalisediminis TaxID=935616 RepID=A0ABV6NP30_9BACI|nr:FAD-dependent oxidoreductase [Halalkalibacter alkalisediminis]